MSCLIKTMASLIVSTIFFSQIIQSADKPLPLYKGKKLEIYILIGQSNMAGRAKITTKENQPIKNAFLLNDKGKFEQAVNPLNRYSTIHKGLSMQKLNPGYGFAKFMTKRSKRRIGLIVNARGASSINA
ncbi:MAG: hypothetical protein COA79_10775 [Planctomycetota bacterium]|nr:MAG: hypothetical protein COA79_10775 [Planctomycetota bacterium]